MYLSALFNEFSRSYIQKMIDRGQVTVNGKTISKNLKINHKDEISLEIKTQSLDLCPEKIDLETVYEDNEILILNKDAGINVHPVPGEGGKEGTLVNAILYHCKDNLPSIGGVERPGIVHRLDKDTSGLIMIAKTDKMMNYLAQTIKDRKIGKYYLAVVSGIITESNFKVESYIGRDPNNRQRMTTRNPVNPKIAVTYGEVIDYIDNKYTLVKLKIETGRTHQIRVHLASIGYPIIGDKVYGNPKVNKEVGTLYQLHRQALHAYELDIELYGKEVHFKAELKDDMKRIIGG
ncbi:MAG: RluA family pseudouridine synthase [Candidatus Gracilibacteria bacterium]|nr:RluA family pseudouridine synthase [Candidatus Gracilibacteria bacterium]